jgi:SAM-dependent methyltransferase
MMFGSREEFEYERCRDCDTLQISSIPHDMARHYPDNYYSFTPKAPTLRERLRLLIRGTDYPDWIATTAKDASIIDIGCGKGALLHMMRQWGFRNLRGYDPYIAEPLSYANGIEISKKPPSATFDVVMMHHSLEHMADPKAALIDAVKLLGEEGQLIIRIPVRQGEPWRLYKEHWVHIDPPRHFYLWTVEGFRRMASEAGLEVVRQGFDSTLYSFAGSELVANDIPIQDGDKSNVGRFSQEQLSEWARRARELNEAGDGDSAWFILKRSRPVS